MGDRANIFLRDDPESPRGIYLYTHWSGHRWPTALVEALKFGQSRWGDPQYLARIIASRVFADQLDSLTGGGLSTFLCDNEYPLLCVDLTTDEVGVCDPDAAPTDKTNWRSVMPFSKFVSIPNVGWDSFQ